MCLLIIKVKKTKSNKLVYKKGSIKCLIILVKLSQIKQSGQKPGYHDF